MTIYNTHIAAEMKARAVAAMEERAAARLAAAERLQALLAAERNGLVRECLQQGIASMLTQQLEFLLAARRMSESTIENL